MDRLNTCSETIVIGGGAVGCAVACSLAAAGEKNIRLIERESAPASITTAQAAGLVGQVRRSIDRTRLAMWSVKTFSEMESNGSVKPSWRQVGSLRVALTEDRVKEFQKLKATADACDLEVDFIDAKTASGLWPLMDFSSAKAILWCPTDGYLQPYDLTMAYVRQARDMGVKVETDTEVLDLEVCEKQITGVITNQGRYSSQKVINAAGAHAFHIAAMAGLQLPIIPVRHEYFITVPSEGVKPELPVVRIPDKRIYLRADVNSILLGGWEPNALSRDPRAQLSTDPSPAIEEDWDVLSEFVDSMLPVLPCLESLGIRHVFKGWPTFVPDGRFIIGESRHCPGFVMAGGCNAHGVSGSAGIGRHVAEAMLNPNPSDYVRSLNPDRFMDSSWDWAPSIVDAQRAYETYYSIEH